MPRKKILIIGGAGYIGSELTDHLLNNQYNVTAIDNLIYDNYFSIKKFINNNDYNFLKININSEKITTNFLNKYDTIVILSGLVGDPITKKYPDLSKNYNINFIKNFINKCKDALINKLIFVSTCSNYGVIEENTTADENHILNPVSEYAKAKIEIENYLKLISTDTNFQTTILRFATAFGLSRRMRFDLTISHFVKDAFYNNELSIFDEKTWRPYCHVKDFSRLIHSVVDNNLKYKLDIFNAGGNNNNYSKEMIASKIKEKIPNLKIKYLKGDLDPRNYKVNFNKVSNIYNFKPNFDLNYGIDELINLLNENYFDFEGTNLNLYGNYNLDKIV